MKIAVLGANGFVGGHILRFLRAHGHDARAVVRRPPAVPDADHRIADACDVYAVRDAFTGCDFVVHAALGSDDVIVDSTAPVYAAAEGAGVRRLVYISTGSVHGQAPAPGTDERSPLSIRQAVPYNNAKVRAERKLQRLRERGTVELVMLRPTIVFGPGSRWIFDFADRLRTRTAYVVDGARGICNSIYVENLAHAVGLALTAPDVDREVFLVSDAELVRWCDLYRPIADALGVDFDRVPSLSPPEPRSTLKQRYVDPLRTSELVRALIRHTPGHVKDVVKRAIRRGRPGAVREPSPSISAGPMQVSASDVPAEIAALQRCRWRLPNDKAARILGYVPPVPFAEGCRRSIEWLAERGAA